jgi:hypothetical protein
MDGRRIYSLEEARALLPRVVPLLKALAEAARESARIEAIANTERKGVTGDGQLLSNPWAEPQGRATLEQHRAVVDRSLGELQAMGIEVKDPYRGLIDFYHERDGQIVYLCYLLGEPGIQAWHTLDGGFAGRQPLE